MAVTPLYKVGRNHEKKPVGVENNDEPTESAVYMFQRIVWDDKKYNLFYDSGCGDLVCRIDAITKLGKRASQVVAGEKQLFGVSDRVLETKHGIW